MPSWWVKDDTKRTDRRTMGGLKIIGKKENSKGPHNFNNSVTQPTQNGMARGGVPSTWQVIGHHSNKKTKRNKENRDCNTVLGSSHWASQLERRPVLSFGGCLHYINRSSCCCYASSYAAPLPPPPLGLGLNGVLIKSLHIL